MEKKTLSNVIKALLIITCMIAIIVTAIIKFNSYMYFTATVKDKQMNETPGSHIVWKTCTLTLDTGETVNIEYNIYDKVETDKSYDFKRNFPLVNYVDIVTED